MEGVVLLDLPDHDSTEVTHHLEVDRIVKLADLLVWVLDPQKYADAAVHDRYLAPQASHAGVMVVVLNHIDTVPAERRPAMLEDVRRLLDQDGLREVPVIATSARHGEGIAGAARRDRPPGGGQEVDPAAHRGGPARRRRPPQRGVRHRQAALAGGRPRRRPWRRRSPTSAGVPTVVAAIERSTRLRARQATGWPVVSWLVAAQARPAAPAAPRPRRRSTSSSPAGRARRSPRRRPCSGPRSTPRSAHSPTTCRPG